MFLAAARAACAIAALAVATEGLSGQSRPTGADADAGPIRTTHPTLKAGLERIARGSSLWREAVQKLHQTGRYVLVLPADQVVVTTAAGGSATSFESSQLAETAPVPRGDSRVDAVMVVVNLKLLEQAHSRNDALPAEFESDVDRILIHEIYGHAVPYLQAGDLSGRCADPAPQQRAADACSIQRENAVRAELRLGRRTDAGLAGLALARGLSASRR